MNSHWYFIIFILSPFPLLGIHLHLQNQISRSVGVFKNLSIFVIHPKQQLRIEGKIKYFPGYSLFIFCANESETIHFENAEANQRIIISKEEIIGLNLLSFMQSVNWNRDLVKIETLNFPRGNIIKTLISVALSGSQTSQSMCD